MKMTLNQLLVEMDGFQQNSGVIVLAATNFPEALDRALIRPGRFDTRVVVPLPDVKGRRELLDHYAKPIPIDKEEVDMDTAFKPAPSNPAPAEPFPPCPSPSERASSPDRSTWTPSRARRRGSPAPTSRI